jgi:WD40 repeat protein
VPTLRLLNAVEGAETHGDEVLACAFTPDHRHVVSGGWDGKLRLWDARTGAHSAEIQVSNKPVSACSVSPDGKRLVSGTLDGMLAFWDAGSFQPGNTYLAHSRPISAITFSADGHWMATASWDRNVILWNQQRHEGKTLSGHGDSVAGCQVSLDGRWVLSWSHDLTLRLWDLVKVREVAKLEGHQDRVLAGAISPDSRWIASGARDALLKLWDVDTRREVASFEMESEVRFCRFLLDGQTLVAGDVTGRLGLYSVPDLAEQGNVQLPQSLHCGALSACGSEVALGCGGGRVCLVEVEGFDSAPLLVVVTQSIRHTSTAFQRLMGKRTEISTYHGTCPVCLNAFEFPGNNPSVQAPCPHCHRQLRVSSVLAPGDQ